MQSDLSQGTLKVISILEGIRKKILSQIEGLSEADALRVPAGFKNCVHWHIGHILHVQLAHWYVRRGEPLPIDLGFRKYFRDGSSPENYDEETPTFSQLLKVYRDYSLDLAPKYGSILESSLIQPFDYMNSHFATVADDLQLLVFHEGEHYPMVQKLLKAISANV